MRSSDELRVASLVLTLGLAAAPAAAQSATFLTTDGYRSVRAVLVGGERGGFVLYEPGTILASRDDSQQRLTIASRIEADLEPGEVREIDVPTYCLDHRRAPPTSGRTLEVVGRVDLDVERVVRDLPGRAGAVHQDAIWALREGATPDARAAALLRRLGVRAKPQRMAAR